MNVNMNRGGLLLFGIPLLILLKIAPKVFKYLRNSRRHVTFKDGKKITQIPNALPLLGNVQDLKANNIHEYLISVNEKYGEMVEFWLPIGQRAVAIGDINVMKIAYQNTEGKLTRGPVADRIAEISDSRSIFSLTGMKWKKHRSLFATTLTDDSLSSFLPHVHEKLVKLTQIFDLDIANKNGESERDIHQDLSHLMMDIIGLTSAGVHFGALDGKFTENIEYLMGNLLGVTARSKIPHIFWPLLRFFEPFDFKKSLRNSQSFFSSLVKNWKNDPEMQKQASILTIFMRKQQDDKDNLFSDDDIIGEIPTFFFAGYETSANTISFALHHLSLYPKYQDMIYEEIMSVTNDQKRFLEYDELKELVFLDKCIKESMRLLPTAGFGIRYTTEDLEAGGYFIPKDTVLFLNGSHLHLHADCWETKDQFNPENFQIEPNDQYMYQPFGAGERSCAGKRLGLFQVKSVLSYLLTHFKFSPAEGKVSSSFSLTVAPTFNGKTGLNIKVSKRD